MPRPLLQTVERNMDDFPDIHEGGGVISCYVLTFNQIVEKIGRRVPTTRHGEKGILILWRANTQDFLKLIARGIALDVRVNVNEGIRRYLLFAETEYNELRQLLDNLGDRIGPEQYLRGPNDLPVIMPRIPKDYLHSEPTQMPVFFKIQLIGFLFTIRHCIFPFGTERATLKRVEHYVNQREGVDSNVNREGNKLLDKLEHATRTDWDAVGTTSQARELRLRLLFDLQTLFRELDKAHPSPPLVRAKLVLEAGHRVAEHGQIERTSSSVECNPWSEDPPLPSVQVPYLAHCLVKYPLPTTPAAGLRSSSSAAKRAHSPEDPRVESSGTQRPKRREGSSQLAERSLAHFVSDRKRRLYGF